MIRLVRQLHDTSLLPSRRFVRESLAFLESPIYRSRDVDEQRAQGELARDLLAVATHLRLRPDVEACKKQVRRFRKHVTLPSRKIAGLTETITRPSPAHRLSKLYAVYRMGIRIRRGAIQRAFNSATAIPGDSCRDFPAIVWAAIELGSERSYWRAMYTMEHDVSDYTVRVCLLRLHANHRTGGASRASVMAHIWSASEKAWFTNGFAAHMSWALAPNRLLKRRSLI